MKKLFANSLSACFLALSALSLSSCYLDYSVRQAENAGSPEFVFTDATFTRIEDRKTILTLDADAIEQYESDSTMYGKGLSFRAFNDDGTVSVEGTCRLFSGNTDEGEYYFLDDVEIESYTHDMFLKSEDVFWNNRTNQLVSSESAPVHIIKHGNSQVTITGEQFSASGFSSSYVFNGPVSGTIETQDDGEDADE
ncbi:MAG: hypothetical protein KBT02_10795 [Treponema sp.]|nr:hypothetical protein [Candidatus Treponema caballi]